MRYLAISKRNGGAGVKRTQMLRIRGYVTEIGLNMDNESINVKLELYVLYNHIDNLDRLSNAFNDLKTRNGKFRQVM